jgi:undecaprenyl diphosphate synthase
MKIPTSIGVIIDGNRRWAKKEGLLSIEGHMAGKEKLKESVQWAKEAGITSVVAYVFSTENWKRTEEEVSYLFDLLKIVFQSENKFWKDEQVKIRFIGQLERLPEDLQRAMKETEKETEENTAITFVVALSYGGRSEIVVAAQRFAELPKELRESANEDTFTQFLSTYGIPDPDLVIRTGGEKRLSNFLLWQIAYSELFFVDTLWPDFSKEEFLNILEEFSGRERRHGK